MKIIDIINYIQYIIIFQISFLIRSINSIDVYVKSTSQSIQSFLDFLPSLSSYEEGVNFYFPDPYYSFSEYDVYGSAVDIDTPIAFISKSENKTIFDYGETDRFGLKFYNSDRNFGNLYFNGIIFKNYTSSRMHILPIYTSNDLFHIVFENCEFYGIKNSFIFTYISNNICRSNENDYQIELNNCIFRYIYT
ncbi:hypothetical protein PIROE2DRAFT_17918 [Piromyces sp. E2]|nr:hypothetical protein PIROE2DRAFT_17918 [Piromyces sp. E2]|eukprot:OUM57167.1 hypothetical protein PIROE2DRAFT_17918 [Piromyces sp. E2]